jgi:adenine-specific DNA-methyltransferase
LERRILYVLDYLSSIEEEGFIFRHYTPYSEKVDGIKRMYFIMENGRRIDGARTTVEQWRSEGYLSDDEYYYLLASIILGVQRVANISGTYGAFNKKWDKRAFKPFRLEFIEVISSPFAHRAYYGDVIELLSRRDFPQADIAYLDPPYNGRQYIANYHILETIARYDNPKIRGISGIRVYSEKEKSQFCMKSRVRTAFFKLFSLLKAKYAILSYNSEGLLSKEDIINIVNRVGKFELKHFEEVEYRRFKSHNNVKRNNVVEYIFVYKRRETL